MPDVIYLQLGAEGLPQFEIAARRVRITEPTAKIVIYTDQSENELAPFEFDEYRQWPHPLKLKRLKQIEATLNSSPTWPRFIKALLQQASFLWSQNRPSLRIWKK
jgi:hypothetical protein